MRKDYYLNSKDYINRWVVSYSDLVTMLLALFMVMYAVSQNVTKCQAQQLAALNAKVAQSSSVQSSYDLGKLEKLLQDKVTFSNSIKVLNESRGLVIRLDNSILFDEGSAIIKPEAYQMINELVDVLSQVDNSIVIEGHTDSTPIKTEKYPSNWELSTARATNIISYVLKQKKITPKRLSAVGYGEYMPIADNTSKGGRILNRRVDIIIMKNN